MAVWALGINHNTAPLDLRGRFAFALDQIAPTLHGLRQSLGSNTRHPGVETAIISTCNRTEIYCAGEQPAVDHTLGWLAQSGGVSPALLASHSYTLEDSLVARHAFRVASGLDSMVLGEAQILGQMKDAVRAAEKALSEEGVTIRNVDKRNLADEMRRFSEIYNEAWADNWGFVPATDAEIEFHAKLMKQVIDEDWAFVAEKEGEAVGAGLSLPDINQVLAKMNGRLLPFGWLRFLLGRRRIDYIRVFALGVKHDFRHTGVAAGLYLKHLAAASPDGVPAGQAGWILETNRPMNRALEGMGGTVVKRYRIYEKTL